MSVQSEAAEYFRLSPQQTFIADQAREYGWSGLWLQAMVETSESIDENVISRKLHEIISEHEILRTRFVLYRGKLVQSIKDSVPVEIKYHDLTDEAQPYQLAKGYSEILLGKMNIDITVEPLLYVHIYRTKPQCWVLLVQASPLVADSHSIKRLLQNLLADSDARSIDTKNIAGTEVVQYADVSEWFYEIAEKSHENIDYWDKTLKSEANFDPLASMQLLPDSIGIEYETFHLMISDELIERAISAAEQMNISSACLFSAIWAAAIAKSSQVDDFVLWQLMPMRSHPQLNNAQGLYCKPVPLSIQNARKSSWYQLCRTLQHLVNDAEEKQEQLDLNRVPRNLYCGVIWNEENIRVRGQNYHMELALTRSDINSLNIVYNSKCYKEEFIHCLGWRFEHLLGKMLYNTSQLIEEVDILSERERHYLVSKVGYNESRGNAQFLPQRVRELALDQPDATAIEFERKKITYREFVVEMQRTASWLKSCGVQAGDRVGVYGDTSPELIYTWFGIMLLGANYITLQPGVDYQRQQYIIEDAKIKTLIYFESSPDFDLGAAQTFLFDREKVDQYCEYTLSNVVSQTETAYCAYTSGSTGKPKGVEVSHLALATYAQAAASLFPKGAGKVFAFLANISADLGYTSIYGGLYSGNTVRLMSRELMLETGLLFSQLSKEPIDYLKIVPSHFQALLEVADNYEWLPRCGIIFGGEVLTGMLLKRVRKISKELTILNHYGPTETTVGATVHCVSSKCNQANIAIGNPLPGYRVLVLDEQKNLVPLGFKGELYIGGNGCADGYLNNRAETAERFVSLYLNNKEDRYYRSGDFVFYNGDGKLVYMGRKDNQVKLRGVRIELEEIERTIKKFIEGRDVCVVSRGDGVASQLVAFFSDKDQRIEPEEIKQRLGKKLSEIMIPTRYEWIDEFPRTESGKIDRQHLSRMPISEITKGFIANKYAGDICSAPIVEELSHIWQELLKNPALEVTDNYFDMGANSLLVMQARKRIQEAFRVDIKLVDFFKYTSIQALAIYIQGEFSSTESETENSIKKIWKNALKIESVELDDNFFDLGANSLLVIQVRKKIFEQFGTDVKLVDFFKYTTVRKLTEYINSKNPHDNSVERTVKGEATAKSRQANKQRRKMARENVV